MGFLDDITGQSGANAAQNAAAIQSAATPIAMGFINDATTQGRADLEPFKQAGQSVLPSLTGLASDPNYQKNFISENPFYKSLADDAQSRLFNNQAARGKVGSGETAKALQNSLVLLGDDLVGKNVARQQGVANMGLGAAGTQAAASQYAGRSLSELATGEANAKAAGVVGAANAEAGGSENLLSGGLSLAGLLTDGNGLSGLSSGLSGASDSIRSLLGLDANTASGGAAQAAGLEPASSGGSFSSTPSPSSISNLIGGQSGLAGFAPGIGAQLGAGIGAGAGGSLTAAAASAPFSGFSGLSGLGSGIGPGSATGGTVGAAAGGGTAGAGLASLAGAALPAAIFALGKNLSDSRRARDIAGFVPTLAAARSGPTVTVNGVTGKQFFGPQGPADGYYLATNPERVVDGSSAIMDVYSVARGEWGVLRQSGFISDATSANETASQANNSGDDAQGPPVSVQVDNSGPRPVYTQVAAPAISGADWLKYRQPDDDLE